MPWYPPPAYATFVKLPDQLDVIDLNASVESGAYVSRMSAAAHAGAASHDPVSESIVVLLSIPQIPALLPVMLV